MYTTIGHESRTGALKWGIAAGAATGMLVYTLAANFEANLHAASSSVQQVSSTVSATSKPAPIPTYGARPVYAIPQDATITSINATPATQVLVFGWPGVTVDVPQVSLVNRIALFGGALLSVAMLYIAKFSQSKPVGAKLSIALAAASGLCRETNHISINIDREKSRTASSCSGQFISVVWPQSQQVAWCLL